MKKILLSTMLICAFAIVKAQTCGSGDIRRWTGTGQPGDMGPSPAPITINGNSSDWDTWISGPFNYASAPKGGLEIDPYLSPVAPANIQKDGLKDAVGANYDRDAVGQDHRDLRYFAFTYDQKNIYFFFRRPKNNTAQVKLYYFIDINVDGFMNTGEPVIQVSFNNSGSSIDMGFYEAVDFNGTAPGSYVAGKGNIMSASITRAKTNNTSEWEVGAADGWSMPGNFVSLSSSVLPALAAGEIFTSATLTDTHVDGTVAGYGVEFAIPWQYLRTYDEQGSTGSPLTYQNIFTWHVSLVSGNSGVSGAEDNAGGCCSGLAVSGAPDISGTPTFTSSSLYDFRYKISYQENRGLNSAVTTSRITIKNPLDANGAPIPGTSVDDWTLTGFKDGDCNTIADGSGITFTYSSILSTGTNYVFTPSNPLDTRMLINANAQGCFLVDINTVTGGWPPLKSATVSFESTTEFNLQTQVCNAVNAGGSTNELQVLPVKFLSFNAVRNGSNVNLTWQTATEEGNTGFEVQKFMGSGDWQTITFVPTQAVNGYSNTTLSYTLTDLNTSRGITQYRLKQIDKNNKSSYSVIRSVRGEGQKGKTIVYPNPSSDGKVNIIFEDVKGIRDITVTDMSGRMIKQMKGVTNNNIQIDNLNAGMYTVRVQNLETGEQVVEKFVVNKR